MPDRETGSIENRASLSSVTRATSVIGISLLGIFFLAHSRQYLICPRKV